MTTLVTNIGQLATPEGRGAAFGPSMGTVRLFEGVEVLLSGGRIDAVGPIGSFAGKRPIDETIDARGGVVLPGLIDPHRHLGAPCIPDGGIVPRSTRRRDEDTDGRLVRALRRGLAGGTCTVGIKCGADANSADELDLLRSVREVDSMLPMRVSSAFLGTPRGTVARARDDRISALIGESIPAVRRRRLTRFCDVACGAGGYAPSEAETILRAARGAGLIPKIHVMESELDAAALLAARLGAASIDHLRNCGARAAAALRDAGVVCVLLPGTTFFFGGRYPNARGMIDAGMAVALGTDFGLEGFGIDSTWLGLTMAMEKMDLSAAEAMTAATLNAAAALDAADETGSVEPGKAADLVILDLEDYREIEGCVGCEPVRTTLVNGRCFDRT